MLKRIKEVFESIAYAGLRPSAGKPLASAEARKSGKFAPVRQRIEKFLNGGSSSDPLYLSNRTFMQRARGWLLIGGLPAILLAGLGLVLLGVFDKSKPVAPPPVGMSDAEVARKMLPDLNRDLHVDSQHDVDIQDVHVIHAGPAKLAGLALNNTDRAFAKVEIVFELTDKNGSRQGAVRTELLNLGAKSSVPFQFAIEQQTASFAIVREVHAR
jgi:hypothetical protein